MTSELDKIEAYFSEATRVWTVNPELVLSRDFFALWEEAQRPVPFLLPEGFIELCSCPIELVEDTNGIAHFHWDTQESCAAFTVEGATCVQTFHVFFQEGVPVVEDGLREFHEEVGMAFGERLELVYDAIAYTRERFPERDIRHLKGREYQEALDGIAEWHDPRFVRTMKRMPASFRDRLIAKALEDMAPDEMSDQLLLPLDGTYADGGRAEAEAMLPDQAPVCEIPGRTLWQIRRDVEILQKLARLTCDRVESFVLRFGKAKALASGGGDSVALHLPCPGRAPVAEGDRLQLFLSGTPQHALGFFYIDICDTDMLYGRVQWADGACDTPIDNLLCARPVQSPAGFIADCLEELVKLMEIPEELSSPALRSALGLDPFVLSAGEAGGGADAFDPSQQRAFAWAVNDANPLVLAQGPPGTGKTTVLEAILRKLVSRGERVLVTAPSNTAADNVVRRVLDLPVLRVGYSRDVVSPDVAENCWWDDTKAQDVFAARRRQCGGAIYAGTQIGVLKARLVRSDFRRNGPFDVIVFDEAGMTRGDELFICLHLARRAVLFGDHFQLPPRNPPDGVMSDLRRECGLLTRAQNTLATRSTLEWLVERRNVPVAMLQCSYRCQNPRLLRFASTLFYDARIRTSENAEYYRLSFQERQQRFPPSTLRMFSTSRLPDSLRREKLVLERGKPGIENRTEARICALLVFEALQRYPLEEVTLIAPYRRQVRLLRNTLAYERVASQLPDTVSEEEWQRFLRMRISTVDSFQGGESEAVIIDYVRSNPEGRIGFVDDANRVNVAHTRCRREMTVVGDVEFLKQAARNRIFHRLERACERDGELIEVSMATLAQCPEVPV
ncbi:MAG: AAA family ATPase [Lentisphaeria bacterium]|nr:AAA family ATPase [Lentisphaeria bacterium]